MNFIWIGSRATEDQTCLFLFFRVNFLIKTSTSGRRDQVWLPWQRYICRSKYGCFCLSPQVTYLQTKIEEGLRFFISNFASLSWRIALNFWISPFESSEEFAIEAHETKKTIFSIPPLDLQWLHYFSYLSDPNLPHKAGPVDLILGVQYTHLYAEDEIPQWFPFEPVAKKTKLGWLIIGSDNHRNSNSVCAINFVQPINL